MALPKLKTVINREKFIRTAAVVFFHGEEGSAALLRNKIKELMLQNLDFDHIKTVFPQAPEILSTVDGNQPRCVWFNRKDYSPTFPEQIESIEKSCSMVRQLVNEIAMRDKVPRSRVVLGGCDMGAQVAMHVAYRYLPDIAGVFGLSTHLGPLSKVYRHILNKRLVNRDTKFPPLLLCHGREDKRVNFKWSAHTAEYFMDLDIETEFQVYFGQDHEMSVHQLNNLREWILKVLPEDNTVFQENATS